MLECHLGATIWLAQQCEAGTHFALESQPQHGNDEPVQLPFVIWT